MSRIVAVVVTLAAVVAPGLAFAKDCEEIKGEIAAKMDQKGVKNYTLEIVKASEVKDGKVVGSCGGGAMKIVYKR